MVDGQRLAELRRQAEMLDQMDTRPGALERPAGAGAVAQQQVQRSYADFGLQAGMMVIVGSVVAGAAGFAMGNKAFYNKMFSVRMVTVATTLGFYSAAGGWIPAPRFMNSIMGREPRQLETKPLWPQRPSSSSSSSAQ